MKQQFVWILMVSLVMLIGLSGFSSISLAVGDKWIKKADMTTKRETLSTSVVNGKIYAIGGREDRNTLKSVEEYDPKSNIWTRKSNMLLERQGLSTSVINGKIYAIGGYGNTGVVVGGGFRYSNLSTVEEYDPVTDTWTRKADMPTTRWALSTSAVNGKIYAIGGSSGGLFPKDFSTVEEYDPVTDTWTKKADMPTARSFLSTSVVNGKIYAIGGYGNRAPWTVEEYNPATDTWTRKSDMPTSRRGHSTSVANGKIYVLGGYNGEVLSTVEEYDPATDKWAKKADMPTARYDLSANTVDEKIYAIGGSSFGRAVSTVEEYRPGLVGLVDEGVGIEAKEKLGTSWGEIKSNHEILKQHEKHEKRQN